ncbi:dienelactone hydrolase family protein [Pseudoxanthomonas sp. JBR18]|uniref:dienelactone hydrolase family protein n=1 Tax=Pseudoxanthomonas sp. JBR18 TaxID=2969308 RepID=UPI002305B860|nr:dienelactone hydrolase family protein [Pseudoxanthomonas sp. JBR18]WCE03222.1 dienelactone hydrolase family protein [Pseudoxanthomonas sp. JBR18]
MRVFSRVVWAGILLACALPALAREVVKPVQWKVGNQGFSGYLVYDDAGPAQRPGLVMVPDWMGVTDGAVKIAGQVAGKDYVVLLADVYGTGVRPANTQEAGKLAGGLKADRPALRARVREAVSVLKAQAGSAPLDVSRIGAFGFCFGGTTVLELVRGGDRLAGVVTLHGGLEPGSTPAAPGSARTPLLVLNGADDPTMPPQVISDFRKEMDAAGADWQFVDFSGAVHCFAIPGADAPGCKYDPRAARRAYRMMGDFFDEVFHQH